jgi:hypothetical protein
MSLNCGHQRAYYSCPRRYEHEELWWNDIGRGKFLIRPPELCGNPTSSHLVSNEEELGEGNYEFGLTKYFCLEVTYLHAVKSYPGQTALFSSLKEGVLLNFIAHRGNSP